MNDHAHHGDVRRLPRSTPAEQGVDVTGVDAFVAALAPLPDVELHSLLVLRHGHVVAERWWHPYRPDTPRVLYSLSKSVVATALGFAVAEGLVDLDATVLSHFPEWDARVVDPRSRSTRVRHVAAMASGHAGERAEQAYRAGDGDLALGLLLVPPEFEPGTFFAYNQPCTTTLAAIVRKVSGCSLTDFLRPRLFEPLGIGTHGWWRDDAGDEAAHLGFHATTETIAKLGQLYLDNGVWQGEQLLPAEWVAEATRAQVATTDPDPDWRQGYGFQFWVSRHGYRAAGAHGQFALVLPEADAVVAMTAQSPNMQGVLDQVWTHLLPALTSGEGPASPRPAHTPDLPLPEGTAGAITPATYRPGPDNQVERLRAVGLGPDELTLADDGPLVRAALGPAGRWTTTDVWATASAWSEGRLHVHVIFVETPHRLRLTLNPADHTFAAVWQAPPLAQLPLAHLRMPR
ncbi:serine hydrolase domain-containing protein [Goodfellowiella coeruleoviolacea]|uniref:CubicO group peptidase, beta-lactamase class C family n=1 Tax=Goodfellowiella coeruleoviolacea TaxID=334858 RepID=A0AAE3GPP2_9PSEU|nr:serine hydrolase domain-containing protein [Goodfellowiella coeruleoviolacea]MCP2169888.1 CubicO group peptidase, beta-lactamase class C family [Goodfellowiella coeruleoviolacea]